MARVSYSQTDTSILNCRQAAIYLDVSIKTIRRWAQSGTLQGQKVGSRGDWRFTMEQLDELVRSQEKATNGPEQDEALFSTVFDSSPVAITLVRAADGRIIDANDRYLELMERKRSEIVGRTIVEIADIRGQRASREIKKLGTIQYGKARTEYKTEIKTKSGETRTIRGAYTAIKVDGEKHIITTHADVTEREKAQENNRFLATLTKNIADAVIGLDKDFRIISWNKGAERLHGWKEKEVIGKWTTEFFKTTFPNSSLTVDDIRNIVTEKGIWRGESIHYRKDGTQIDILATIAAIHDDADKTTGYVALYSDIGDRKKAELDLKFREERYRVLFNSITAGFSIIEMLYDKQGKPYDYCFIEANEAYERHTLLKPQGKTIRQLIPTVPQDTIDRFAEVVATGRDYRETTYSESRKKWFDVHAMKIGGENGNLAALIVRDVTESHSIAQERAEAARKVIDMLESIGEAFVQVDASLNIVMANEAFARMNGIPRKKLVGQNLKELYTRGGRVSPFDFDKLHKAIKKQQPVEFLDYYYEPLNIWVDVRGYPTDGAMSMFVRDITQDKLAEQKQAELMQLSLEREQLIKINYAKDEFIGIASHQLRTPATGVKQYIGMLLEGFGGPVDESQRKFLEMAYTSNERQIKLINDLLKTAQIDASTYAVKRSPQSIGSLLQNAVASQEQRLDERKQIVIVNNLASNVKANVDPTEIDIVFTNLLENASKYSPERSTITITLSRDANSVQIAVADNGVGTNPEDRARIFEKFTRATSKLSQQVSGSGFGLYWVKQIVEMHGGSVTVSSNAPRGSVFTVTLPL